MTGYLKRFSAMVKNLQRYEHVELLDFTPQPPATPKQLNDIESKLKVTLDPALRAFYTEMNGMVLHWRIRRDLGQEEAKRLRARSRDYYIKIAEYVGDPFAMINLLPIQDSLVNHRWKSIRIEAESKTIDVGSRPYAITTLSKLIKPFDVFSEEHCMAFLFIPDSGSVSVVLLGEGCRSWDYSRMTNFESYIEMLIATRGIVDARLKIFGDAGADLEKMVIGGAEFWKNSYTPELFICTDDS